MWRRLRLNLQEKQSLGCAKGIIINYRRRFIDECFDNLNGIHGVTLLTNANYPRFCLITANTVIFSLLLSLVLLPVLMELSARSKEEEVVEKEFEPQLDDLA